MARLPYTRVAKAALPEARDKNRPFRRDDADADVDDDDEAAWDATPSAARK